MTKQQYRAISYLWFFFSFWNLYFLIHALISKTGFDRAAFCILYGFGFVTNLRLAVEMYRKSKDLDLK